MAQTWHSSQGPATLYADTTVILVKFDDDINVEQRDSLISTIDQLSERVDGLPTIDGFVACSVDPSVAYNGLYDTLSEIDGIYLVEPFYTNEHGYPMIVGQGILLTFTDENKNSFIDSLVEILGIIRDDDFDEFGPLQRFLNTDQSGRQVVELANILDDLPSVSIANPDFYADIIRSSTSPYSLYDYYHTEQDHIKKIIGEFNSGRTVWDFAGTANTIVVAVIDDGVTAHEDLPSSRIVAGYDFCCNDNDPSPGRFEAHGMGCAGLIAASHTTDSTFSGDSTTGMISMMPHASIMPIKIFPDCECSPAPMCLCCDGITLGDLVRAIDSAWTWGADILSNSWSFTDPNHNGFPELDAALLRAYTQGRNGKGCPVIFAAGNYGDSIQGTIAYPTRNDSVFSVGATMLSDSLWHYSCYGVDLDICAPSGELCFNGDVFTLDQMEDLFGYNYLFYDTAACFHDDTWDFCLNSNYDCFFGGTSAACPLVAGSAALLLSRNFDLTVSQIYNILDSSAADVLGIDTLCKDTADFLWGRVDAYRAMLSITRGDVNNDGSINVGDAVYLVAYVFSNGPAPVPDILNGDANCSGDVESGDAVFIISYVFKEGPLPNICFKY